jgi:Ser/Thr protein kinase RdoA (MazF antagonist)
MPTNTTPQGVLADWKTIIGARAELGDEYAGRDLWSVMAEDGARYVLKRLGPWRNLPLADEARILRHLANLGVPVAEFLLTDRATLHAGEVEESFVLIPLLMNDRFTSPDLIPLEPTIGASVAHLHLALARYPWPANSYIEDLSASLVGHLVLPSDIAAGFAEVRASTASAAGGLPIQLVHGDFTPDNVLLRRPGTVSGFIDFDHLPLAPRIWDIAKYLSRRIRLGWRREIDAPQVGRLDHLAGFLRGYHGASPLMVAEVDAIPALMLGANVLEISYFAEIAAGTLHRRMLSDHNAVLDDTIEAVRWHLAHHDDVVMAVQRGTG